MDNNSERVFYAFLSFASFRSSYPASVAGDGDESKTLGTNGAPGEIRTPYPLVRSQVLYPNELRTH